MPLMLDESDVSRVLEMPALVDAMERAVERYSRGEVRQPLRAVLEVGDRAGWLGVMPAAVPEPPAAGVKLVTVFGGNAARGLPTHLATILLFDSRTGALLALVDGRLITEARTAAASAVSVRHLCPGEAPLTVALLGSGVQARSHLEAIRCVRPMSEVRVWSRTAAHARRLAEEASGRLAVPMRAAATAEEAVRGADLVVLVTASSTPVVESGWVRDGAHVVAVGACRPDQREMDSDLVARGRVIVDSRAGALAEAGDLLIPISEGRITPDHIAGELGEVVAGRVAGRTSPAEVTIFESLGMAIEDVAAASLVLDRARAAGAGREFAW